MDSNSWQSVQAIFDEIVDLEPVARAPRLDAICGIDTPLRGELDRMLAADAAPDRFAPAAEAILEEDADAVAAGTRVGDFRIVRRIASGGMGTVFEAIQEHPRRRVALKLLSAGLGTEEAAQRFRIEAEALARLAHPGIAQVFASGTHSDGILSIPWHALEFIDGARAITKYASEEGLSVEARVRLFASVCDAIQYAHSNGVIHRDLKPGNVLVDARGNPKVIDFGVARVTSEGAPATIGQLAGTPNYMSPEQWDDPRSVDTRSDVWSLGVLFFELLTGELPFAAAAGAPQAPRAARDAPARRLSAVDRRFAGDLEWIAAKALERDRERRYSTVADLAADLRRHLAHEPVVAVPPSRAYRLQRFVRRNRVAVSAALLILVSLVGGIVASLVGLGKARESGERARLEATRANATVGVLEEIFGEVIHRGADARVADLVEAGVALVRKRSDLDPESRAHLLLILSNAISRCGDLPRQRAAAADAALLSEEVLGRDDPRTCYARLIQAQAAAEMGDEAAARALLDELIPNYRRFIAERVPNEIVHHTWIGRVAWQCGRYEETVELEERALASGLVPTGSYDFVFGELTRAAALTSQRKWDEARPTIDRLWQARLDRGSAGEKAQTLDLDLHLREIKASLLQHDGKRREAVDLQREARDLWVSREGERSPFVVRATRVLASYLLAVEDFPEAKREAQRAAGIAREVMAPLAANRLAAESMLAECTAKAGGPEEAIPQLRDAIATRESAGGPQSLDVVEARLHLADILQLARRFSEAESEARRALEVARKLDPNNDNRIATLSLILANSIQNQNRPAEAEPLFADIAAKYREDFPDTPWRSARVDIYHARALRDLGRFEDAEAKLLAALPVMTAEFGPQGARTRDALMGLANLYMKWNKPAEERKYLALLQEARSATSRPAK